MLLTLSLHNTKLQDSSTTIWAYNLFIYFIFHIQTLVERTLRYMVFNWMPRWVMRKGAVKDLLYRPLAMFLPLPEVRGPLERLPQKPCKRGLVDQHQTSVV